jgi:hypothetical protein
MRFSIVPAVGKRYVESWAAQGSVALACHNRRTGSRNDIGDFRAFN